MIRALLGEVFQNQINPLTLMVHGVGYAVFMPVQTLVSFRKGEQVFLYIHTHVRDDTLELYGFLLNEELRLFELLLEVPGIGPRTALLVIDRGVNQVEKAIHEADVDFFTTVPRLGKKNAQKIIIELKTRLGSLADLDLRQESGETKQVVDALTVMGFAKNEIFSAIKQLSNDDKTIEGKIRHALRLLAK